MFKFLISLALVLQVFPSTSDQEPLLGSRRDFTDSSAANVMPGAFDYGAQQNTSNSRSTLVSVTNSITEPVPSVKTLNLNDGMACVPLSVLEQITGKDYKNPSAQLGVVLTALQLQNGLIQFDQLLTALDQFKGASFESSVIAYSVSKIPCILVQFEGGLLTVSEQIYALFKSGQKVQTAYSQLELLLMNFCCFQAEAVSMLG